MIKNGFKRQWYSLTKPLTKSTYTPIDEEIRQAKLALNNLITRKKHGEKGQRHYRRIKEVEGIELVFFGRGNNKMALAVDRQTDANKYDRDIQVVIGSLTKDGYDPQKCTKSIVSLEKGCEV